MLKKESGRAALFAAAPLGYLLLAVALVAAMAVNGEYPSGSDTMSHLYRGDVVFRSLAQGTLPPYYDAMWFNGTELFRFVPPVSAWALALCQALAGGNIFFGYLLFVGGEFYLGALLWWELGRKEGRVALGSVLGALWFFMPYHVHVLFVEGDLARSLAITLLPRLFYDAGLFLRLRNRGRGLLLALEMCLLTLTHPGFAGMTALALLLWAFLPGRLRPREGGGMALAGLLLSGALLAGLWLGPYLASGILRLEWWEEMGSGFQSLFQTLDPGRLWSDSAAATCGTGLTVVLCFIALLGGGRERRGAVTALLLLLCTSTTFCALVQLFPQSQHLRMLWVFPSMAALGFFALLHWAGLRRGFSVLLCLLLLLDALPLLSLMTGSGQESLSVEARMDQVMSAALLDRAQELTAQRLAILDEGELGSQGIFLATAYSRPVPITGGDKRAYATTRLRQDRISRALSSRNYSYLFDRCLELGCDTVLLRRAEVPQEDWLSGDLNRAAERLGYELAETTGSYALYHMEAAPGWGLVSRYSAIGIGESAYRLSLCFPSMEETQDPCLDHYSLEELSGYQLVYLSGVTYEDKAAAERMIRLLAQRGTRVVIDAETLPEDRSSRDQSFLGVRCNNITFSNGYPELEVEGELLQTDLFPREQVNWQSVYLEGLTHVIGKAWDNGLELPFCGTAESENILFLGLGLERYLYLTQDRAVRELFTHVTGLSHATLPSRRLVPLSVEYDGPALTVTVGEDGVNTTLSFHDAFTSEQALENRNQLLTVNAGTTRITLRYPHLALSLLLTLAGALLLAAILLRGKELPPPEEGPGQDGQEPSQGGEQP